MDKKEKVELDLVPQMCGFSTGDHANLKCDVEYDTLPTAHRSVKASAKNKYEANNSTVSPFATVNASLPVKQGANLYITSASHESPTKKSILYVIPT
eukprot:2608382-Ditylum_brightwellii.AAC.1